MPKIVLPLLVSLAMVLAGCAMVAGTAGVAGVAGTAGDRRMMRVLIEDAAIELQVRDALRKAEAAGPETRINVTSYNRYVLLTGQVPDAETKRRAARVAGRVRGVRGVHDEVTVGPQISAAVWSSDGLVTARAKVALTASPIKSPIAVKVVTESGIVYLMGLVSREEMEQATDAVRTIPGVREIVRLFEYVD